MAIMGRMACYTGQVITWEQALNSTEDLSPPRYDWNVSLPVPPVARPGVVTAQAQPPIQPAPPPAQPQPQIQQTQAQRPQQAPQQQQAEEATMGRRLFGRLLRRR